MYLFEKWFATLFILELTAAFALHFFSACTVIAVLVSSFQDSLDQACSLSKLSGSGRLYIMHSNLIWLAQVVEFKSDIIRIYFSILNILVAGFDQIV